MSVVQEVTAAERSKLKWYYALTGVGLVAVVIAGLVFAASIDRRFKTEEDRIEKVEREQEEQGERIRIVERTVTQPPEQTVVTRERVVVVERPAPTPDPVPPEPPEPLPEPAPPQPPDEPGPLAELLAPEPEPRKCKDIKNKEKRQKCRENRKAQDDSSGPTEAPRQGDRGARDSRRGSARR